MSFPLVLTLKMEPSVPRWQPERTSRGYYLKELLIAVLHTRKIFVPKGTAEINVSVFSISAYLG